MKIKKFNENFKRRVSLNESFFENIDSKEKAYALGLICSDGSIDNDGYAFSFISKDIQLVEVFKKIISSGHKICEIKSHDKRTNKIYTRFTIHVCSKKMVSDLRDIGIYNNKSFTCALPVINKSLFWHFFRGLFDGDGSIHTVDNKEGRLRFKIMGSSVMIREIKEILDEYGLNNVKITSLPYINEIGAMSSISYGSYDDLKLLYDKLYENSDNLRLERKYIKFSSLKKYEVGKYDRISKLKEVIQMDMDFNLINIFKNKFEAANELKISQKSIQEVLNGRKKHVRGFIFRYKK
jgi:ribosomal protein L15E